MYVGDGVASAGALSWWPLFQANLSALEQIGPALSTDMTSTWSTIYNDGLAIEQNVLAAVQQPAQQAVATFDTMTTDVENWFNNAYQFAQQVGNVDLSGGLLAGSNGFNSWMNEFTSGPTQALSDLANAIGQTASSITTAATSAASEVSTLVSYLPWIIAGGIGLFLLADLLED